ncbi:MAG TPA: SDR family oxidoreductase [Myxococcota bacterium]
MTPTMSPTLIVTGGSTGIGAATARTFIEAGWRVISLARRACPVPGVVSVAVDFTFAGWEAQIEQQVLPRLDGGVVCVVHNAALLEKDNALALDTQRLRHILEVNVVAPATLNRLLRPRLTAGSSILFVGSTLSEKAVANTASYVTSKHALVGLMRATCQDAVGTGIHTVCVCPGFVETEMLRAHIAGGGSVVDVDSVLKSLGGMSAHGRLIQPDEIARLLLACAQQPVLDGAVLHANLGQIEH